MTRFFEKFQPIVKASGYGEPPPDGKPIRELHKLLLARGCRCTAASVGNWIHGHRTPELAYLIPLLDALGVTGQLRKDLIYLAVDPAGLALRPGSDALEGL